MGQTNTILRSDFDRYLKDEGADHPTSYDKESNGRTCNATGALLQVHVTGRSIWHRPFMGGSGEVRRITHLHCAGCEPDRWKNLRYGEPVYDDELMEVR